METLSLRFCHRLDRETATEQIPVTVDIVDPANDWPEFMFPRPGSRVGSRFSGIASIPWVGQKILGGMGRALENIVFPIGFTCFDGTNLAID
jgi:hypothetical protein